MEVPFWSSWWKFHCKCKSTYLLYQLTVEFTSDEHVILPSGSSDDRGTTPTRTWYCCISPNGLVGGSQDTFRERPVPFSSKSLTVMLSMLTAAGGSGKVSIEQCCILGICLQNKVWFLIGDSWKKKCHHQENMSSLFVGQGKHLLWNDTGFLDRWLDVVQLLGVHQNYFWYSKQLQDNTQLLLQLKTSAHCISLQGKYFEKVEVNVLQWSFLPPIDLHHSDQWPPMCVLVVKCSRTWSPRLQQVQCCQLFHWQTCGNWCSVVQVVESLERWKSWTKDCTFEHK